MSPDDVPASIDRYRIDGVLGQGGMGRVYRGFDPRLRRPVALKVLRDDARAPGAAAAILREARAAAAIRHPNIVVVYDVAEWQGVPYLAMEWIDGARLRDLVADARVSLPERAGWLMEIASALATAHAEGFVHRDLKPENVMIGADRSARVLDFGLARRAGDETSATTRDAALAPGHVRVLGTPQYMAPEHLYGEIPTARSDQYAWGVVAYELLAGVHPATTVGAATPEVFARVEPRPLGEIAPGLPPALAAIVHRAMAKAPAARFGSMAEVIRALAPFAPAPGSSHRARLAGPGSADSFSPGGPSQATAPEGPRAFPGAPPVGVTTTTGSGAALAPIPAAAGPGRSSAAGVIVVAVIALVVLAGLGTGAYFLVTSGEDTHAAAAPTGARATATGTATATATATPARATVAVPRGTAPIVKIGGATATATATATTTATATATATVTATAPAPAPTHASCNNPSACSNTQVCLGNVCTDCPSGRFRGPANACFDVCGAGGSCAGKAWPGSVCTPFGGRQMCIPPGFQ